MRVPDRARLLTRLTTTTAATAVVVTVVRYKNCRVPIRTQTGSLGRISHGEKIIIIITTTTLYESNLRTRGGGELQSRPAGIVNTLPVAILCYCIHGYHRTTTLILL